LFRPGPSSSRSRGGAKGAKGARGAKGAKGGRGALRGGRGEGREGRESRRYPPRKPIKFQLPKDVQIDYKEISLLQKFVSDRGKILSRRFTGASAKEQRALVRCIKQARFLGLLTILGISNK